MTATDTRSTTDPSGPLGPITPDSDDLAGRGRNKAPRRRLNLKAVLVILGVVALVIAAVFITATIKDHQAETLLRKQQMTDAKNDLNNRLQEQNVEGEFTRVFFVGDEMRAEFRSADKTRRCIMAVNPEDPRKGINRYSTKDVEVDTSVFSELERPNDIGGLEAVACGGVG